MAKKGTRPMRVLAHMNAAQESSRAMTRGILRYAATHPHLSVRLYDSHQASPADRFRYFASWTPDALICGATAWSRTDVRDLAAGGCRAVVFVNAAAPDGFALKSSSILCDNAAVADAAAAFFRRKALASFACVGTVTDDDWSRARVLRFADALAAVGADVRAYPLGGSQFIATTRPRSVRLDWRADEQALAAFLAARPKPCGVFAACDRRALDVLTACRAGGLDVPGQVQILGVDNEEFLCEQTAPGLSSVLPDFEGGGYAALETADALLARRVKRLAPRLFGVKGLVERASTQDAKGFDVLIARARAFMGRTFASPVSVAEVARAAGASQRGLERAFKAVCGRTCAEDLRELRLARACRLLRATSTRLDRIADLCGFGNDIYLRTLFKRRFGCTMRQYRSGGGRPGMTGTQ